MSEYIRDACIYENIIEINLSYADEVNASFQEYITEVRKITKEVRRLLKYDTSMSDEERHNLQHQLYIIYSQMKSLKNAVSSSLQKTNQTN